MEKLIAVIAIVGWFFTSPAAADWQYTKWGMSIEQVTKASGSTLRPPTPEEQTKLIVNGVPPSLIGKYDNGSFQFIAILYFGGAGKTLSQVHLRLQDYEQRRSLLPALQSIHGEPLAQTHSTIGDTLKWRDDRARNEIEVYNMSSISTLTVMYSPLASAKGL